MASTFESDKTDTPYSVGALPDYAGSFAPMFLNNPIDFPDYTNLNPAPGSVDLIEARSARGVVANARGNLTLGPVKANDREYSGINTYIHRFTSNPMGPVKGGDDYNTGRLLAYQASQIQALTQAESAAAISGAR